MRELTSTEIQAVNGGLVKIAAEGVAIALLYDTLKFAVTYYHQNSYMGRGTFPRVHRPGHE